MDKQTVVLRIAPVAIIHHVKLDYSVVEVAIVVQNVTMMALAK